MGACRVVHKVVLELDARDASPVGAKELGIGLPHAVGAEQQEPVEAENVLSPALPRSRQGVPSGDLPQNSTAQRLIWREVVDPREPAAL